MEFRRSEIQSLVLGSSQAELAICFFKIERIACRTAPVVRLSTAVQETLYINFVTGLSIFLILIITDILVFSTVSIIKQ
jgi:hypothetical protein